MPSLHDDHKRIEKIIKSMENPISARVEEIISSKDYDPTQIALRVVELETRNQKQFEKIVSLQAAMYSERSAKDAEIENLSESAEILKKMLADAHAENAAATDEYRQLLGVMRYALKWMDKEKCPVAYGAIEHALKDVTRKNLEA